MLLVSWESVQTSDQMLLVSRQFDEMLQRSDQSLLVSRGLYRSLIKGC